MNEQLESQTKALLKAFEYGIDYGLLIAEEERDSEDVFDAFLCAEVARKYCSIRAGKTPNAAKPKLAKGQARKLFKILRFDS